MPCPLQRRRDVPLLCISILASLRPLLFFWLVPVDEVSSFSIKGPFAFSKHVNSCNIVSCSVRKKAELQYWQDQRVASVCVVVSEQREADDGYRHICCAYRPSNRESILSFKRGFPSYLFWRCQSRLLAGEGGGLLSGYRTEWSVPSIEEVSNSEEVSLLRQFLDFLALCKKGIWNPTDDVILIDSCWSFLLVDWLFKLAVWVHRSNCYGLLKYKMYLTKLRLLPYGACEVKSWRRFFLGRKGKTANRMLNTSTYQT